MNQLIKKFRGISYSGSYRPFGQRPGDFSSIYEPDLAAESQNICWTSESARLCCLHRAICVEAPAAGRTLTSTDWPQRIDLNGHLLSLLALLEIVNFILRGWTSSKNMCFPKSLEMEFWIVTNDATHPKNILKSSFYHFFTVLGHLFKK